jgi:hypothetical protein
MGQSSCGWDGRNGGFGDTIAQISEYLSPFFAKLQDIVLRM